MSSYSFTHPRNDDASNADTDFGSFQQAIAQVDAVPEGHEISLNLKQLS